MSEPKKENSSTMYTNGDPKWNKFIAQHRKTLDMGSYTMNYIDVGRVEPLVIVHGMMLYKYSWRNNIHALLDSGFRAIPVDLPGYGQTDIPPDPYPYTVDQVANDIVTMTNKLGLEQFHLKRSMINPIL